MGTGLTDAVTGGAGD